tara:strand:+ start:1675 stop:3390 length:1716 start_codon:yes stop_codon:yes gene_type:complete
MSDSFINLSKTDFDQVRNSLTSFIRSKPEFSDYDFAGSALSTLIDLLAYNTAFFSTYTNFLANESFIDSAQKRDSLMSLARLVGYTPKSRIASRAILNVTTTATNGIIPSNTVFSGSDTGYIFITKEDIFLASDGGSTTTSSGTITVYQNSSGSITNNTTFFNGKVVIPEQADITNLKVFVGSDQFSKADRISVLSSASEIFFIDPIFSGAYEVSFGDGTYGKDIDVNSNVRVEYLTPNGINNANGESNFSTVASGISINSVVTDSYGGAERETTESIRRNAPSYFQAQNRAVTANDAEIVFKVDNPQVYDATAWGGEDNNPPQYGRLFLSAIKDAAGATFSQEELSQFAAKLQDKTVVGIIPEFKDRSCYQINISSGRVVYDYLVNSDGTGLLELTRTKIEEYNPDCSFKGIFAYSDIVSDLVTQNAAIRAVDLNINISATFSTDIYSNLDIPRNIFISFANSIEPGSIFTDVFRIKEYLGDVERFGFLDDDGNGFIRFGGINSSGYFNYRIGTVDYNNGNITILNFTDWDATNFTDDLIIHAIPTTSSVRSIRQATYNLGKIENIGLVQ